MWKSTNAIVILALMLAGCATQPGSTRIPAATRTVSTVTIAPSFTLSAAITNSPLPSTTNTTAPPLPGPTQATLLPPTPAKLQMCSPLQDLTIPELFTIVTNPFATPLPGQADSGHHGVDFSYYRRGSHIGMTGLPIFSVLNGKVAAAILDRPPYGNMVIVETPLEALPGNFIATLAVTPVPTQAQPDNHLSCPPYPPHPAWRLDQRSVYLLYAHMAKAPLVKVGDTVACGGQLGEVGNTGSSGNPHLHFETRLGPSGAAFTSMSHYNNQATTQEMANYCTWRVSGTFEMFDPLKFLGLGKN